MAKKQLDYHKVKIEKVKQVEGKIAVIAKQNKVRPSDFKNRKAYLNYISRKAGFENYSKWQKARREANITPHRGGRGQHFEYTYTLKRFTHFPIEQNVIEAFFKKINTSKDQQEKSKYFVVEWFGKDKTISRQSKTYEDIDYLLEWLNQEFTQTSPKILKQMGDKSSAKIRLFLYQAYLESLQKNTNSDYESELNF